MKIDAEHVAALLSDPTYFNRPQKELAACLGISQVRFSNFKAEAIEKNLLRPMPPKLNIKNGIDKQKVKDDLHQLIGSSEFENRLIKISENALERVLVFGSKKNSKSKNYQALSVGAARYLAERIADRSTLCTGVAWGETVRNVVNEIIRARKGYGVKDTQDKKFVPVCGDSHLALSNTSQRGSKLIKLLYEAYTGSDENHFSHSVAASIPGSFEGSELRVIRRFLMHVGDFGNVFKLDNDYNLRLKVNLDLLITSCGTNSKSSNNWLGECATREGIDPDKLENITVGNLSGYWLGKPGLDDDERTLLDDINARWNGICYQDFKELYARKAIALIAGSPEKADIVFHLIKNKRLISHLMISADLADAIESKLESAQVY